MQKQEFGLRDMKTLYGRNGHEIGVGIRRGMTVVSSTIQLTLSRQRSEFLRKMRKVADGTCHSNVIWPVTKHAAEIHKDVLLGVDMQLTDRYTVTPFQLLVANIAIY